MKIKNIFGLIIFCLFFGQPSISTGLTAEELGTNFFTADTPKAAYELHELARKHINLLEEIVFTYKNNPNHPWHRAAALSFLIQFSWDGSYPREKFFDIACEALKGIQDHPPSYGKEEEYREYINDLGGYSFVRAFNVGRVPLAENFEAYIILVNALGKHDLIFNKMVVQEIPKRIEVAKQDFFEKNEEKAAISKIQEIIDLTLALGEKDIHPDARRIVRRYGENLILHIQTEIKKMKE